jgi:hypothetical protein
MVVKGDLAALVSFAFFYAATFAIAIWAAEMRIREERRERERKAQAPMTDQERRITDAAFGVRNRLDAGHDIEAVIRFLKDSGLDFLDSISALRRAGLEPNEAKRAVYNSSAWADEAKGAIALQDAMRQRAAQETKSVDRVEAELFQLYAARTQDPFVDVKAVKEEIRRRREEIRRRREEIRRRNLARIFRDEG